MNCNGDDSAKQGMESTLLANQVDVQENHEMVVDEENTADNDNKASQGLKYRSP